MSSAHEERLGPYKIVSPIGKGGMGEVYRAVDTRLQREVAVKFGAAEFSDRFRVEARAVAALNHPNICTLHDVGPDYLVMELVEGVTLAERIREGAIPLEEALGIARQIVDALAAAHEKGITHRDLKPGNVMIRADGTVKVLDFGLAKMAEPSAPAGADPENSPTLTELETRVGAILGTAGYMAPEQARGKAVDKRADIWAFGVVLYEMVTGRRLFEGEDATEILASVVKDQPDLSTAPVAVRRLLGRCLEKDRRKRLRDIGDVWELLEEPVPHLGRRSVVPWVAATVLLAACLGAGGVYWLRGTASETPVVRFTVEPPPGYRISEAAESAGISPDGRLLVYAARPAGEAAGSNSLWLRPLDSLTARQLPGTEGAGAPFWSPDGKSIAYIAGGKLNRIDIGGGAPTVVCDADGIGEGGAWNSKGILLFSMRDGLFRVAASGGIPERVTQVDAARQERSHSHPVFLSDESRFLYHIDSTPDVSGIYAGSLDGRQSKVRILQTDRKALYLPQAGGKGSLLWMRRQTLLAQTFDDTGLRLEGEPVPVAQNIATPFPRVGGSRGRAAWWASKAGLLAYRTGAAQGLYNFHLVRVGRDGRRIGASLPEGFLPRMSPDGNRVAMVHSDAGNSDVWLWDSVRGIRTRLTFSPATDAIPVWSPDGRQIAFSSDGTGAAQVYRIGAASGGSGERLLEGSNPQFPDDWSRDGNYLLFTEMNDAATGSDIWALPLEGPGKGKPVEIARTPFSEGSGRFSPDGKWVVYHSNESGQMEIYVRAFAGGSVAGSSPKWQVSGNGGSRPAWRGDGQELFYLHYGGIFPGVDAGSDPLGQATKAALMSVSVRITPSGPEFGTPRELFTATFFPNHLVPYDVSPDGQSFVMAESRVGPQQETAFPLVVVQNWRAGLKP